MQSIYSINVKKARLLRIYWEQIKYKTKEKNLCCSNLHWMLLLHERGTIGFLWLWLKKKRRKSKVALLPWWWEREQHGTFTSWQWMTANILSLRGETNTDCERAGLGLKLRMLSAKIMAGHKKLWKVWLRLNRSGGPSSLENTVLSWAARGLLGGVELWPLPQIQTVVSFF